MDKAADGRRATRDADRHQREVLEAGDEADWARGDGDVTRRPLPAAYRRDRYQVGYGVGERSAGIQLMRAALPEERLDFGEVSQDHRSFQWSLPVAVRRSACDPVKDHVSRGAEQDYRVETVVELRLVPRAPSNEQRAIIIGVQQPGDLFLDPEPLSAVQLVGGLNVLAILAPARIVGVYDAITASAKFREPTTCRFLTAPSPILSTSGPPNPYDGATRCWHARQYISPPNRSRLTTRV